MTETEIREAGAAAVADFPPMPDETAAHLGRLLATATDPKEAKADERRDRAA